MTPPCPMVHAILLHSETGWLESTSLPNGMVRPWALEAMAHGAETVSYFRWWPAPFAQEQMHSGLLRPNCEQAEAFGEAKEAIDAMNAVNWPEIEKSDIAIVFDYPSAWAWEIQPQGKEFDYFHLIYDFYRALRRRGLSVDFVPQNAPDLVDRNLRISRSLTIFRPASQEGC